MNDEKSKTFNEKTKKTIDKKRTPREDSQEIKTTSEKRSRRISLDYYQQSRLSKSKKDKSGRNKSTSEIQQRRYRDRDGSLHQKRNKSNSSSKTIIRNSINSSENRDEGKHQLDFERTQVIRRITITLRDLRNALDKEKLKELLNNSFNPNEEIEIIYERSMDKKEASFFEDQLTPKIKRRKKKIVHVHKSLTEIYSKYYKKYNHPENTNEADQKIVLGCYLQLYQHYFGEEDPNFAGKKSVKSELYLIQKMAGVVTDGNYEIIIQFLEEIIPLWAKRMKSGHSFPNLRPTFNGLFVKRHFWSNRKNYARQWK